MSSWRREERVAVAAGEARRLHRRYQASWIADIDLKTGLFRAIAAAADAISDTDVAGRLDLDPRWCRSAYAFELPEWDHAAGYRLASECVPPARRRRPVVHGWPHAVLSPPSTRTSAPFPTIWPPEGAWPLSEHDPWLLEALKNTTNPDSGVWTETVLPQAPAALARL